MTDGFRIEWIETAKLKPAEYNPRKDLQPSDPEYIQIQKSINEFGLVDPLVVNSDMTVIGGHQRLKVLTGAGFDKVPCSIVTLDKTKEKALNIALNKISGEWDFPKLKDLIVELDTGGFDLDAVGWKPKELDDVFSKLGGWRDEQEEDFDVDEAIDQIKEPVSKRGDIWLCGRHRIMCGDSTNAEDVGRLMDGKKADMVFTDPPYNALKSWHKDEAKSETRLNPNKWFKNDNMEWPEFEQFLITSFMLFTGHSIYVCCDYRIYPLVERLLRKCGWDIKHCIVWKKNVWGLGKRYRFQHEFLVYACNEEAPFYGDRSQSDVWEVDVDRSTDHNTPKPTGLSKIALCNSSEIDNMVYDSFLGSGSTLIGAEQTNRICYGMEIEPLYVDVSVKRWEEYTGEKAVLSGTTA